MLKPIIITILCVVLFIQPVNELLTVFSYVINKEFIATVLCINRDRPELGCQGKCQLAEQFKEKEKQKNKSEGTILNKVDLIFFLPASVENLFPPIEQKNFFIEYNTNLPFAPPASIFHPPRVFLSIMTR